MFVGESLKNLRILFGHSQKTLAELLGLKERDIWQYENGYAEPDFHTVNILKSYFHVKSRYFYSMDIISKKETDVDVSHISFHFYNDLGERN